MRKFTKNLKKISIQGRIAIAFCVLMTVSSITASALAFTLVRQYSRNTAIFHSEQILSLVIQNMDGIFDTVENLARQTVSDDVIIKYCEDVASMSEYERIMRERDLSQNLISGILRSNTQVSTIFLYPKEGYCLSFGKAAKMATEDYQDEEVYRQGIQEEGVCWFRTRQVQESYGQKEDVISMSWPVRASDSWNVIGLLEMQIPVSQVVASLDELNEGENSGVLLLDEEGQFAVVESEEFQDAEELFRAVQQKEMKTKSIPMEIEDKEYLVNHGKLKNGWILIHYQLMENLTRTSNEVCMIILTFGICMLFFMLLLSRSLSRHLVRPLHEAIDSTRNIEIGDELKSDQKEIAALYDNYNLMMRRIRESELDTLRAQISPHFLYNTLNSIKCRALLDRNKDVAQMIQWLINLLELSINNRNEYVTLNEEIEILKSYVGLQKMRTGRKFLFTADISKEELGRCLIPKMILQTLVENAILHGFEEKEEAGKIFVRAAEQNQNLVIEVIDDGEGMSEERICEVLSGKMEESKGKLNRVGIYNVDQRIKLYFGKTYGLSIESTLGEGTKVILRMPCVKKPEAFQGGKANDKGGYC